MRRLPTLVCLALCCTMAACRPHDRSHNVEVAKQLIQARINDSVDATRTKDIDRYMRLIPQDWAIHDEKGATLGREDYPAP